MEWYCDVFKSTDGGMTWPQGTFAYGGDKCWMAIDRTGGIGHGNIYEAWNTGGNMYYPSTFTRSVDGGATWIYPIELPHRPVFGTVHVDPDGKLYIVGVPNSMYTSEFWVLKSTNAEREKMGKRKLDDDEVNDSLHKLAEIESVERVEEQPGTWRIIEKHHIGSR